MPADFECCRLRAWRGIVAAHFNRTRAPKASRSSDERNENAPPDHLSSRRLYKYIGQLLHSGYSIYGFNNFYFRNMFLNF